MEKKGKAILRDGGADSFLVQIYGGKRVVFEACRRILELTDETVLLEGKIQVKITGEKLRLLELGGGNLGVAGRIDSIAFLRKGVSLHDV